MEYSAELVTVQYEWNTLWYLWQCGSGIQFDTGESPVVGEYEYVQYRTGDNAPLLEYNAILGHWWQNNPHILDPINTPRNW